MFVIGNENNTQVKLEAYSGGVQIIAAKGEYEQILAVLRHDGTLEICWLDRDEADELGIKCDSNDRIVINDES
jgi:hypothetical protein